MMKRVYVAAALVAGLLLPVAAGWAQSTGAVRGTRRGREGAADAGRRGQPGLPGRRDPEVRHQDQQEGRVHAGRARARRLPDHRQQGRLPGHVPRHADRPRRADAAPRDEADEQGRRPGRGRRRGGQGQRRAARDVREGQPAQRRRQGRTRPIAAYKEVLAKNPQIAEAHYNIGYLHQPEEGLAGGGGGVPEGPRGAARLRARPCPRWRASTRTAASRPRRRSCWPRRPPTTRTTPRCSSTSASST